MTPTTVTDIKTVAIPSILTAPLYRAINLAAGMVETSLSSQYASGVLVAENGTVEAHWLNYLGERDSNDQDVKHVLGLATATLFLVIDQIQEIIIPKLFMMNIEPRTISISVVRIRGVSDGWLAKVTKSNSSHHQLLMV